MIGDSILPDQPIMSEGSPPAAPKPTTPGRPFKILIVDDDQAIRQMYSLELTSRGYVISEGIDGEDGLNKAQLDKPDLVLLDIMMPKMDGIATLSRLKENPELKDIPIVMLTNFGQENLVQQAFTAGVTDYILKYKVTPSEMAEKIGQMLTAQPVQL